MNVNREKLIKKLGPMAAEVASGVENLINEMVRTVDVDDIIEPPFICLSPKNVSGWSLCYLVKDGDIYRDMDVLQEMLRALDDGGWELSEIGAAVKGARLQLKILESYYSHWAGDDDPSVEELGAATLPEEWTYEI